MCIMMLAIHLQMTDGRKDINSNSVLELKIFNKIKNNLKLL